MGFTDTQVKHLQSALSTEFVSKRTQAGRELSYIEGHHAIREANRIFGFGDWSRETVYNKEVCRYPVLVGQRKEDGFKVGYEARVRITVAGVTREGTGHGQSVSKDLFDAIEGSAKEAETDAMKRALMTFGDQFGLALYDKDQRHVDSAQERANRTKSIDWTDAALSELEGMELDARNKWSDDNVEKLDWLQKKYPDLYKDIMNKVKGN